MTIAPEEMLLRQILDLAAMTGWRAFHVSNSTREIVRKSGARVRVRNVNPQGVGFPDLVLVSAKQKRIVFAELKRDLGPRGGASDHQQPTLEQEAWLADLSAVAEASALMNYTPISVHVWRPKDYAAVLATLAQEPTDETRGTR